VNKVLSFLKLMWRLLQTSLAALFIPVQFLWSPFAKFWPRRLFNRRAKAWASAPMGTSRHPLSEGMFRPPTLGRASPQVILRPVNGWFVLLTLLLALLLNLLPWGNWHWTPDWLALTLTFWVCREPRLIGFGIAFIMGLLMDVHDGTVVGEHALAYVLLAYAAHMLSRRLPSFDAPSQALHVWPVFLLTQFASVLVRVFFGGTFPGWGATLIAPTLSALLWPLLTWVLLSPQRKPLVIDNTRPL
jgi:rod shape-determining protein MreD